MTPFSLAQERLAQDVPVVVVRGELDLYTAPELASCLRAELRREPRHLVVDLSACDFVDASGCRVLLTAARRLAASNGKLVIVNTNEAIDRVFRVMGFDELFPVVETRTEAGRTLRSQAR